MYTLTWLEAGSLQSRCQQGHSISEGCRKESVLALSSFWWSLAILSIPWAVTAPLQSLPLSWHPPLVLFPVSVCTVLLWEHQSLDLGPILIRPHDFILTKYVCKDISKHGHNLRLHVDINLRGTLINLLQSVSLCQALAWHSGHKNEQKLQSIEGRPLRSFGRGNWSCQEVGEAFLDSEV